MVECIKETILFPDNALSGRNNVNEKKHIKKKKKKLRCSVVEETRELEISRTENMQIKLRAN